MIVSYFYSTPYESFFQKCVKKKGEKKIQSLKFKTKSEVKSGK